MTGKDVEVTLKFKNAHILRAMRARGIKSVAELSRLSGVGYQMLVNIVSMRLQAMRLDGEWSQAAYSISSALGMEPEELWPNEMARVSLRRNTAKLEANLEELARVSANTDKLALNDIYLLGNCLTERERYVLNRRYGLCGEDEATLEEISKDMNRSRHLVHVIESRALRKLRRAAHRKQLDYSSFAA